MTKLTRAKMVTPTTLALIDLDDAESYFWKRINELPNPEERLRLKSLLVDVLTMLRNIEA